MTFIEMSFASIILIIGIMIIRAFFLNKLPKITFLILWGVVFIRLALPLSFTTSFSLNTFLLQSFITDSTSHTALSSIGNHLDLTSSPLTISHIELPLLESYTQAQGANRIEISTFNWLAAIWLIGTTLTLSFFLLNYWKANQKLSCAFPHQKEFLNRWQLEQELKRPIKILISDQIVTPLTLGILKPRIILPADMDLEDQTNLHYILAHEFYHIKRFDSLWKLFAIFILCLHWFNPLVWIAFILANRDLEISCDAWVLKQFGEKIKKTYAHALLSVAEHQNQFIPLHNNFARFAVEERIVSVMKTKKTTLVGSIAAFGIIGLLTFHAFAAAPDYGQEAHVEKNMDSIVTAIPEEWLPSSEINPILEDIPIDEDRFIDEDDELDESFNGSVPNVANLREITTGNMTVRVGDLFSRYDISHDYDPALLTDHLSAEAAAAIMIRTLYQEYDFDADGLILDIFPSLLYRFSDENEPDVAQWHWIGLLLSADYDPTIRMPETGYVPSNNQIHFFITICAETGEIIRILDSVVG